MVKYVMTLKMYSGDNDPSARFAFLANNDQEACRKASKWAQYHGFSYRIDNPEWSEVGFRLPKGQEQEWEPVDFV